MTSPSGRTASGVLGLRRLPVLTGALWVLGVVFGVAGLVRPSVLAALQRTPEALHGEWWRWLTSLLVQDGGVAGTVSNLLFLLVVGAAAEQVRSRRALLGLYLVAGLAGQVAGQLWQPFGGGNSVAICGLAGGLAWAIDRPAAPPWAGVAALLWLGALLATWWPPLIVLGAVAAGLDRSLRAYPRRRRSVLVAATATTAALLLAMSNVHGAALAVGLAAGALPRDRGLPASGGDR